MRRGGASRASTPSSGGAPGALGATAIEHPLGVRERAPAAAQEHEQVVEHVGGLFVEALVGLLAGRARDLLGLLHDLLADALGVVEQRDRVGARGPLARPLGQRPLERRQRLEGGRGAQLAAMKTGSLTGVTRRA